MKVYVHMTWYDSESVTLPSGLSNDDILDQVNDIVADAVAFNERGEPDEVEWEIEDD